MSQSPDQYRAALLVDMRQRLATPARALGEYCELIATAATPLQHADLNTDLERISDASQHLNELVDRLLTGELPAEYRAMENEDIQRHLRHDLRTPINGILGFGEMILEDIEDYDAEIIKEDLEQLLSETRSLLQQLDSIVRFSRQPAGSDADVAGRSVLADGEQTEPDRALSDLLNKIGDGNANGNDEITGNILVVDDIKTNRDLLQRRLSQDGHTVLTAENGRKALATLGDNSVDLVLLDLMMPDLNGFEVLERMKADPEQRNIPVIIISALEETDGAIRCIEQGAHDYLPKPFNPVLLRARIRSGLASKQWTDEEREQRKFIQDAFSRFISRTVVSQLIEDPSKLTLGGERTEITCVFTDLADFTSLIETSDPTKVLPLLNEYLDGMCKIVLEHHGTIDKIVGDALHAFFGAPLKQPDHAQMAVKCAVALDAYAHEFKDRDDARALKFGVTRIGVHTGIGVVGNFGGDAFFDYTAHGDVVNTAARMESVNKHLGTTVCVSQDTVSLCSGIQFRPVGELLLKGKSRTVRAWMPPGKMAQTAPLADYLTAYQLMCDNQPDAAREFENLHKQCPTDALALLHYKRLKNGAVGARITPGEK